MNYNRVFAGFFTDEDVLAWEVEGRHFALYLLACNYRTAEGFYYLPLAHASLEWGLKRDKMLGWLAYLEKEGFLKWDAERSLVLLLNGLKYEPPRGPLQEKGAMNKLQALPRATPLWLPFYWCCERYAPNLGEMVKRAGYVSADAVKEGLGNPFDTLSNALSLSHTHTQAQDTLSDGTDLFVETPKPRKPVDPVEADAQAVFTYYCKVMNKNGTYLFKDKRHASVVARLREGYTVDDLCRAVDGCRATPHNMGENDRGTEYNDLELICRNCMNVDRFKGKAGKAVPVDERRTRVEAARKWLASGKHEAGARALVKDDDEWMEVTRNG